MNKGLWGHLKRVSPFSLGLNLFVLLTAFMAWEIYSMETAQKLYFVFGVFALYALSFFSTPKRRLKDWRIGVFVLWCLFSMFWHSQIITSSFTYRYLNFYLMSEGFIHVFCAILLYRLIYENVDRLPAIYHACLIYLGRVLMIKSLTPIFAVIICSLIYCIAKKRYLLSLFILVCVCLFIGSNFDYIASKWQARAFGWPYTIKEIIQSPLGYGFDKNLMSNMILKPVAGWGFRHNDFLNIARDLGLPALVIIGLYLQRFFKSFRLNLLSMACLCGLIICCFQTTAYMPKNGVLIICLFALWEVKYAIRK